MTVGICKVDIGDKVTLGHFEVSGVDLINKRITVIRPSDGSYLGFPFSDIVTRHPRDMQVGDKVLGRGYRGVIRSIDKGEVWVRWETSDIFPVWRDCDLTLVTDDQ